MTYTTSSHIAEHSPAAMFPSGLDTRWETISRMVFNEQERTAEEQELVYEVSWIPELNAWRRFLRSQRKTTASPTI